MCHSPRHAAATASSLSCSIPTPEWSSLGIKAVDDPSFSLSDCALPGFMCPVLDGNILTFKKNGETEMGKRDELIAKYADDLRNKCGMEPDMDLLTKVTIGCGPAIYDADASTVAGSQPSELETVKKNFLMKKLGLADSDDLMAAIDSVIETYGRSERNKYRAVIYYMLTKHFGKESVYG
jgi:hypothetical protein